MKHTEVPKPLYPVNATVPTSAHLKPSGAHHPLPTTVAKEPVVAAKPPTQPSDKSLSKYVVILCMIIYILLGGGSWTTLISENHLEKVGMVITCNVLGYFL